MAGGGSGLWRYRKVTPGTYPLFQRVKGLKGTWHTPKAGLSWWWGLSRHFSGAVFLFGNMVARTCPRSDASGQDVS
jgi:hypothetical protein